VEDLFRSYWWLLFPLFWMVAGGFHSLMRYRRSRDAMELAKQYVAQGKEPPPELLQGVAGNDDWGYYGRRGYWGRSRMPWPARAVFFGLLCAGFAYAAYIDLYGAGEAFGIVAFVTGAILVATVVARLFAGPTPKE